MTNLVQALTRELTLPLTTLATGVKMGRLPGGAGLLAGETNGFAADFIYSVNAKRIAVKASGVVTEYAPDDFISNIGTSPKQVFNAAGVLSWSPHNMFLNSAAPVTQNVTLVVGQTYTMSVTGSGSLAGSSGASGTATAGAPATFVATGTTGTFTKTGTLTTMQLNRGAVPTAYLATTGSARNGVALDYDPVTLAARGLLVEPAATNLLLNSTMLSTQSVTVTAAAHTLSFWGTGTITLSGTSTAGPLVGTGAGNRVSLTFTPTAGSLTLTVSGTVSNAQLETGSYASSPIPTYSLTGARVADNCSFLLSAIPALGTEYSLYCRFATPVPGSFLYPFVISDGTAAENAGFIVTPAVTLTVRDNNVAVGSAAAGTVVANTPISAAGRVKANDCAVSANGSAVVADTSVTLPVVTKVGFGGGSAGTASLTTMRIAKMAIVPRGWSNAELQARSAA